MSRLTEMTPFGFSDIASPSLRIYYPAELPGGRDAPVLAVAEGAGACRWWCSCTGSAALGRGAVPARHCTRLPTMGDATRSTRSLRCRRRRGEYQRHRLFTGRCCRRRRGGTRLARTSWPGRTAQGSRRWPSTRVVPRRAQEWRPSGTPGSKGGGRLAAQGEVGCVAGISGTWDDNESRIDSRQRTGPHVAIATEEDIGTISAQPRNQPFLRAVSAPSSDHALWDWPLGPQ